MAHEHGHDPQPWEPPPQPGSDEERAAATKSLSDALHVSFRLLSVIMVLVVLVWLVGTGMSCVEPTERAVRLVFGKIQGTGDAQVLSEGLTWTWPEPFGQVRPVPTVEKVLEIDDFWMHVRESDANKPLAERQPMSKGLRAGWDGALLTGDRVLFHVKLTCKYKLGVRATGPPGAREAAPDPRAVLDFLYHTSKAEEFVRSAVCAAAIRSAAARTLESVYPTGQGAFAVDVLQKAQKCLDEMGSGIHILRVEVPMLTVPLAAIPAFTDESKARQQLDQQRNKARGQAIDLLISTAKDNWRILAGRLDRERRTRSEDLLKERADVFGRYLRARSGGDSSEAARLVGEVSEFGLMELYAQAREAENGKLAGQVLEEVNRVLMSHQTGGAAADIIKQADRYYTSITQRTKAWADGFTELLPAFTRTPELFVQRHWEDARTQVLANPAIEKIYLPKGQKIIIRVSADPRVRRKIERFRVQSRAARVEEPEPPAPPRPPRRMRERATH